MPENNREIKKITIEVIDTPRGPVPTAETLRKIVEIWNELIYRVNENLEKIANSVSILNKTISEMRIKVNSLESKLGLLQKDITELKFDFDQLKLKIDSISGLYRKGKLENFAISGSVKKGQSNKLVKRDEIKNILLSDSKIKSITKKKLEDELKRLTFSDDIIKIDCNEEEIPIDIKRLASKVKSNPLVIVNKDEKKVYLLFTAICKDKGLEGYMLDLSVTPIDVFKKLLEGILEGFEGFVILVKNFDLLFSESIKKSFPVKLAQVINIITELVDKQNSLKNVNIILQVNNVDLVDPILLKKVKSIS